MLFCQAEQALQDSKALWSTVLIEVFGPGARIDTQKPTTIQQPVGTPFNNGAFVVVDMGRISAEATWFLPHVDRNGLPALIVDVDQFAIPPCPDLTSHVLGRHGVVGFVDFHITISMYCARRLVKDRI